MKNYELIQENGVVVAEVRAKSKPGLLVTATEALYEAMGATSPGKEVERPFRVDADDFLGLLSSLLKEILRQSKENNEAYEGIRFRLITATQAEGDLIGQSVERRQKEIGDIEVRTDELLKDEKREWCATIAFS